MYSTVSMVRLALVPEIADPSKIPPSPSRTAADLPDPQLADAIAEADAQIDAMIGKFYATPVQPVGSPSPAIPHPLDYWSRNIAAYNATLTFRKGLDLLDTDPVVRRWKATLDALTLVATGKSTLTLPTNQGPGGATGGGPPVNPYSGTMFPMGDFSLTVGDPHPLDGHWRSQW